MFPVKKTTGKLVINDDLLNNCWMTSFSSSIHLKSGILRNGDFKKFFIPRFIFCCGCCDLW